jgi:3,4-dihydroxy 2-butanone 4-phosphate synthase/GTP cyclohydrolase II
VSAVECFAAGGTVLVGGAQNTFVATPAETVDAASLESLHELGRGMVVLALDHAIADRLALPLSGHASRVSVDLPFTASVDAAGGVGGGWTLRDRAHTMRVAADPASAPCDLRIPGHVHPVRVRHGQLLEGRGDGAAAALELARLSSRTPAVALCLVVDSTGAPVSSDGAPRDRGLARLPTASVTGLRDAMRARQASEVVVSCSLPTRGGSFQAVAHVPTANGDAVVALVHGDVTLRRDPLVHVHAGCLLGDVFASLLCSCRAELQAAFAAIVSEGAGIVLYTKPQVTSLELTRHPERSLDAAVAAGLLRTIGVGRVRLAGPDNRLAESLRALGVQAEPATRLPRVA